MTLCERLSRQKVNSHIPNKCPYHHGGYATITEAQLYRDKATEHGLSIRYTEYSYSVFGETMHHFAIDCRVGTPDQLTAFYEWELEYAKCSVIAQYVQDLISDILNE